MIFGLMTAMAVLHFLQRPSKPIALQSPSVLISYLKTAGQIFGAVSILYLIAFTFKRFLPECADLLPGLILIFAFAAGKIFKLPETLLGMIFCAGIYLEPKPELAALSKAALISLGMVTLEWAVDGIRFRLIFTSSANRFSTLPGLLTLFALATLAFSGFFFPGR